jgi:IS30 family transposase
VEDKHKNGTLHLNLRRKGKKYNKRGNLIHTITADNGKEFAKHQEIAKELDISFYFCKPYHSWERGANENSPKRDLVISHQTRNLIYY